MAGSFHSAAMLIASWKAPSATAPSPKKQATTCARFCILNARAMPAASGIAIVAGAIPLAAGMALAFKMQKRAQVVACFFGDGAVAEGAFHEAINMAALWKLPAIFVCENNLYGASTHISKVMKNTRVSDRATAYGCRGETVDGNDVLAVYEATRHAAADCRGANGPVLLELLTYRRTGHSRRDPCGYQ